MKNLKLTIVSIFLLIALVMNAQTNEKATLYIVRTSGLGAAVNFKYFIDDQYVGKCNFGKYFKLEVDTGKHLIWAKAENRSFVEANLEAGKTYVINAVPQMGALKAGVYLKAENNPDEKDMEKIKKYIEKKKLIVYDEKKKKLEQQDYEGFIEKSMTFYNEKVKGQPDVAKLTEAIEL